MKLILSRKGFDSSAGGVASPILPDGSLFSLPIPQASATICYRDLEGPAPVARLVEDLTRGKISGDSGCHLDPDLLSGTVSRARGWRPLFGQCGAAQGHLNNQKVEPGDLFLFFGWFRQVRQQKGHWRFRPGSPNLHVLYGWFQIGEILDLAVHPTGKQAWMAYHAHCDGKQRGNNTLFVASKELCLPGLKQPFPGAGLFPKFHANLCLTRPGSNRSTWLLPRWFSSEGRASVLSYHQRRKWSNEGDMVRLESAYRGQEFVLRCDDYPESLDWVGRLLTG